MTDVISSDLLQQLMTLSDMSTYSKFLAMNQDWISLIFSLIPFAVFFCMDFHKNNKINIFLVVLSFAIVLFVTFSADVPSNKMNKLTLNKPQIVLLKSIQVPEFQTLIQESIRKKGANLDAIKTAINEYKNNNEKDKERIENDENGRKGLELYNSIEVK